jgi:hypothetical protein
MTYGELQSWPTCNSLTICLRTFSFASTRIIYSRQHQHDDGEVQLKNCTFLAITTLVEACMTLLTVPPLPAPSSFRTIKSSLRRSSLNSRPISRVSALLPSAFPVPPGICASLSEGLEALGWALIRVRPLAFLRLKVFGLKESDILAVLNVVSKSNARTRDESFWCSDTIDCTNLRLPSRGIRVRGYKGTMAAIESSRYQ